MTSLLVFQQLLEMRKWYSNDNQMNNITDAWIDSIKDGVERVSALMMAVAISVKLLFKWDGLWKKVDQMDRVSSFPKTFYLKLRRLFVVSTALSFTSVKEIPCN